MKWWSRIPILWSAHDDLNGEFIRPIEVVSEPTEPSEYIYGGPSVGFVFFLPKTSWFFQKERALLVILAYTKRIDIGKHFPCVVTVTSWLSSMTEAQTHYIEPAQLRIGMYIYLDMGWMDHPFLSVVFEIRNEDQLQSCAHSG